MRANATAAVMVNELRGLAGESRLALAALCMVALLVAAIALGMRQQMIEHARAKQAQQDAYRVWLAQGEKNPHSAAHFGLYAFRQTLPLAHLEPGITAYSGPAVWMEAHKQNLPVFRAADELGIADRFPGLTPAFVLQILLPLIVIVFAHDAVTGERERGTLRMVLATGISPRRFVVAKSCAASMAALLLVAPVAIAALAAAVLFGPDSAHGVPDALARSAGLVLAAVLYAVLFATLSVGVSSVARSSRESLAVLLVFWACTVVLLPRAAGLLADRAAIVPTAQEFRHALDADLKRVRDPIWTDDGTPSQFEAQLLARHGASHRNELGFSVRGLALQEDEVVGYPVFERHFGALWDAFERQERTGFALSLLSPALALSRASMGFAGTDLGHERRFVEAAEVHRRAFMQFLNDDLKRQPAKQEYAYLARQDLWARAPNFSYSPPAASEAWRAQAPSLAVLAAWLAAAAVFAGFSGARIRAI